MKAWLTRLARSFRNAARGLAKVVFIQRNARLHLVAMLLAAVTGAWLRITRVEWCLIVLACGLVLAIEAANSAIERLADRVTLERDERVRDAKDAAAGATLLASTAALLTGALVFLPRIMLKFGW